METTAECSRSVLVPTRREGAVYDGNGTRVGNRGVSSSLRTDPHFHDGSARMMTALAVAAIIGLICAVAFYADTVQ
jgi:hypothetical protein